MKPKKKKEQKKKERNGNMAAGMICEKNDRSKRLPLKDIS